METEKNKYGRRISAIRHFLGMTQEQLADALGISRRTLQNYENGCNVPTVDTWEKLNGMAAKLVGSQQCKEVEWTH